ncbi:transposable element Tcb1 transposase [Trichonephila clavipes]|uniref:Transposable element Tcb1 transposase n=1 Tax=Trichonephila clavipes TaxID=2585209 RepID=A0A8X7BD53_TRICX|nr:transposable element Tcb1 transposase [Trichonephila clavipes]
MWSIVAQRLTQITLPAAIPDQLWQRLEAAWSAVPQKHIQSLFESMPRRVAVHKIAITNSEGYEEEFVKNLYETIIANGKRLEELERAEKMRLEELVREQALKEKELQLKFDLERFKIESVFSPELVCLPLAVVEISGNFGTVQTKAAVCGNHLNQHGRYLLGNKTAELIEGNLGYNFLPVEILNAVQTRSQVKAAREKRGIDSVDAKKGEDEVIIVSSDAEDEILIPALQEYVPELGLLRVTRENLINAQKIAKRLNPYTNRQPVKCRLPIRFIR